jgi:hypothetical protein
MKKWIVFGCLFAACVQAFSQSPLTTMQFREMVRRHERMLDGSLLDLSASSPISYLPLNYLATTSSVGLQLDKGLLIENPYLATGTQTNFAAYSNLGFNQRVSGRSALWLNSAWRQTAAGLYDLSAEMYFGTGTNMDDASLRWSLSSRPHSPLGTAHDLKQLAIYQMADSGASEEIRKRMAVFPDTTNNASGSIMFGCDTRYPNPDPPANASFYFVDWLKNPRLTLQAVTNVGTGVQPVFEMNAGGNKFELWFVASNSTITAKMNDVEVFGTTTGGAFRVSSLVVGTNPAAMDFGATNVVFEGHVTSYDPVTRTLTINEP